MNIPRALSILVACAAISLSCGGRQGGATFNAITPMRVQGCPTLSTEIPADLRSLAAMVATIDAARYEIHEIDVTAFKVYTKYKDARGLQLGWKAQIYSDGSLDLMLPETMPPQPAGLLPKLEKHAQKLVRAFEKQRCLDAAELRRRTEKFGLKI